MFRLIVVVWWGLLLAGCGSLPPRGEVLPSQAFSAEQTAATPLARVAAASRPAGTVAAHSGFRLLPTGEYAFDARAALAEAAERGIDAQYYHVHHDTAGVAFLRSLRDAARRGVRVRLLVDDFHAGEVFDLLLALNTEPNAQVRLFNPLRHRGNLPLLRLLKSWPEFDRVNRRMHNKLFVADGAVAIYGGRNVADEYFMRGGQANFIDLDVVSVGPLVAQFSAIFDRYWNSDHAWPADQVPGAGSRMEYERRIFEQRTAELPLALRLPPTDPLGQTSVRAQVAAGRLQMRWGPGTAVADSPSKVTDPVVINQPTPAMMAKLDVIAQAKTEVLIVNPYFIPGEIGMRMMAEAARQNVRGVIFTNSLASTDEPLVHRAYARYREAMLRLGMELFELNPQQTQRSGDYGDFGRSVGRLHVKGAAVDRRWLLVGSVNLDARSALHNTEMAVTIDSPELVTDALAALGGAPWRNMYRVELDTAAPAGRTLRWRAIGADGKTEHLAEEPHDSVWQRFVHWLQSFIVTEEQL